MFANRAAGNTFAFSTLRNHLFIEVPWDQADRLRGRLQARGIAATACFDPAERLAGLEIHQTVDREYLRSILSASGG